METIIKQFLTGDPETDSQVREIALNGACWQIRNLAKTISNPFLSIEGQIKTMEKSIQQEYAHQKNLIEKNIPYWFRSMSADRIQEKEHKLFKLLFKRKIITGLAEGIKPETIILAKQYPIQNLIEVNKNNKAICLFHNDKHPSLHVFEDNKFKCFSCGKRGDAIDIFMELNRCDFKTAIEELSNIKRILT